MIKEKNVGTKYVNAPENNISSCSASSGGTLNKAKSLMYRAGTQRDQHFQKQKDRI
jgi:hypothetical protein